MSNIKVVIKTSSNPNITDVITVDEIWVDGVNRTNEFEISDQYFISDVNDELDDLIHLKQHIANVLGVDIDDIDFEIQHN